MLLLAKFFAINAKIENIVFLITLKAKKVFFKILHRFDKIFSVKNAKKVFRSKNTRKKFFGLKKVFLGQKCKKSQVLDVKSKTKYRYERSFQIYEEKMSSTI